MNNYEKNVKNKYFYMNFKRVLIIIFGIILMVVMILSIYLNRSMSKSIDKKVSIDDILLINISCMPEIIRNYRMINNFSPIKNTLFFRYHGSSCSSCTIDYLSDILDFQEIIGKDRVWIFPAAPNDRLSRIKLNNELAKYNYLNIPIDSLYIPTYNGEQKSYFAWINGDGDIDMVFIPDVNNRLLLHKFFLEVIRKINEHHK